MTRQIEPVHLPSAAVHVDRWSWQLAAACAGIGALSGFAAAMVRLGFRGLQWLLTRSAGDPPTAALGLPEWRRLLTPVVGALLATGVLALRRWHARRLGRQPRAYVEYVAAVRHRGGFVPLVPNCWRTLSAACSVSSGAAVGREGSMIQFAAAVASTVTRWRGWGREGRGVSKAFLVACGVAGGVTTAYNAPLAAIFFAAEIVLGGMEWRELPLLGLASGAGWLVSGSLLGWARLYPAPAALSWSRGLAWLPVLAVVCGLLGPAYQWLLGSVRRLRKLPLALVWSGLLVGGLSVMDPRVWGNGDMGLAAALGEASTQGVASGPHAVAHLLLLRLLATLGCVWTGTVGGVFTPTLFAGGSVGALLGHAVAGEAAGRLWSVAGMSLLMAAVTHAPWMAALMVVELTGNWRLLPLLLALNWVAWQLARRISPQAMYAIASQTPTQGARRPPR